MIKLELYKCLTKNLTPIKDVRLVYATDEECELLISIFYDETAKNYSKTETAIFDAYTDCCVQTPHRHAEILVMIYRDSIDIPKHAVILLKRNRIENNE